MPMATMTSKGQVTIPKSIRDTFSIKPGDLVQDDPEQTALAIKAIETCCTLVEPGFISQIAQKHLLSIKKRQVVGFYPAEMIDGCVVAVCG